LACLAFPVLTGLKVTTTATTIAIFAVCFAAFVGLPRPEAIVKLCSSIEPASWSPAKLLTSTVASVVIGENPSNHVFVDLDVARQGDVLGDSRTAPVGITLLHFDDRMNKFCARALRAGLPKALR